MRDHAEVSNGTATATHGVDSGALFIITLSSSTAPVALEAPAIPELIGLAVFRSRRVEDGRDRFRLHLGYFDSAAAAEALLPVVRRHYPAAWVGPAPQSGMGSLDDTNVAQFKFIRAPKTLVRDPAVPAAAAVPAVPTRPSILVAAKPSVPASKAVPARATASPAAPKPRAAAPKQRPVANKPAAPPLAPKQVLNLLEPSSPHSAPAPKAPMQPMERAAVIGAIQRFAVQIVWSMDPVDLAQVPKLAIFDAYTLYKVQVDRAGRRWYGLRLGFFGDPVSARQVALYSRSDFSAAAVVPVSDRECERAEQAAITEFPAQPDARKAEDAMELFEEPAPSQAQAPAKPQKAQKAPAAARSALSRAKTARDLAEELQMAPDFSGDSDPLNDSGVRHLAVRIVEKKSLGGLFSRGRRDKRKH